MDLGDKFFIYSNVLKDICLSYQSQCGTNERSGNWDGSVSKGFLDAVKIKKK